ncbi:hypothetical protein FPOAC1_010133 [Fusarium poae]|uniref:hypothetical protein n=1 Tax=Fusarium poae TaxID=36050 RepID=UPI001CE8F5E6|nr:hypothetical protein FPOAC1_010133 [Fusarium poae]KAG8670699.1 hypothetical protein FPOAC1_010133 [Fusarium poae]
MFAESNLSACSSSDSSPVMTPATDYVKVEKGKPGSLPPPPKTLPSRFSSCAVSDAIPITGWGEMDDVRLAPSVPPTSTLPEKKTFGFLPSAIGYSGLVQDEYLALPAMVRSDVSLPEYEFYHYVLWWYRVYHVHHLSDESVSDARVNALPFALYERLDFPIASSLYQHLMCLGDFEHHGKTRFLQPPLLTTDPENLFGLKSMDLPEIGWSRSRLLYEWSTSPSLFRHLRRVSDHMFPNLPSEHLPFRKSSHELDHTNLLNEPGCFCDLRHRSQFLSSLQSVVSSSSPLAMEKFSYSELLQLASSIGHRLRPVYTARVFDRSPNGSLLQLTFNSYLHHTTVHECVSLDSIVHDRTRPSLPDLGYVPDSSPHLSAALRLDFQPSIPDAVFRDLDVLAECYEVSCSAHSYWNRFRDTAPLPLRSSYFRARKFLSTVSLTDVLLPE